jgi:hypothetical protein
MCQSVDCLEDALSNPAVDIFMMGARSVEEMRESLKAIELGPLDERVMARIRRIGDHIYGRPRVPRPRRIQACIADLSDIQSA